MPHARQEAIRARALALWEADGRPEGRDLDYWLAAERELVREAEVDVSAAAPAVLEKVAPKKAAPRKAASRPAAEKAPATKAKAEKPAAEKPAAKKPRATKAKAEV